MNIRKPNQLRFYKLFEYDNDTYKIRFIGSKEQDKVNGDLNIFVLNEDTHAVISQKKFTFVETNTITDQIKTVTNYIRRIIKDKVQQTKVQTYITENLN